MALGAGRRQAGMVFIFVTLFIDILGIGIIIPILPELIREFLGGNVAQALETARQALLVAGFDAVDYFELRDDHDLQPLMSADRPGRLFVAAWLDGVRLIDNTPVKAVFNAPIDRRKIPEPA